MNRRAALAAIGALAAGSAIGAGYALRGLFEAPAQTWRNTNAPGDDGMGMDPADMQRYMQMFARHGEIRRTVEEIPGGIRTTTESDAPDLAAQLRSHVADMYARLEQGAEIMCMSASLPGLFRGATAYRRTLTFTATGIIAEEVSDDPVLAQAIRDHAREVSGFVRDGMPAMMAGMMGQGGMMPPHHHS
jgi:hypothetical protein